MRVWPAPCEGYLWTRIPEGASRPPDAKWMATLPGKRKTIRVEAWPEFDWANAFPVLAPDRRFARLHLHADPDLTFHGNVSRVISSINLPTYWTGRDIHVRIWAPSNEAPSPDEGQASRDMADVDGRNRLPPIAGLDLSIRYALRGFPMGVAAEDAGECEARLTAHGRLFVISHASPGWDKSYAVIFSGKQDLHRYFVESFVSEPEVISVSSGGLPGALSPDDLNLRGWEFRGGARGWARTAASELYGRGQQRAKRALLAV